ncbi:hypothetical protein H072_9868 [Dactylellina haptotyla CBS 200.50]|uniref:J domain-containing protein n=1 Tax=Dactylellina haptotyla (strain CBS 200.50) TaxID=1284197 RepID=S8A5Z9_DACHA|nr:hypothetical protein H072_9868 [Dactylellina haptotyla CBS 200.50]
MDTYYYDLLEINSQSTDIDIKKAYRRLAFINHPDKNPGDENAHQKFLEIAEAYQVLTDPELRAQYDKDYQLYEFARFLIAIGILETSHPNDDFDPERYREEQEKNREQIKQEKITKFHEEMKEKREKRVIDVAEKLIERLDLFPSDPQKEKGFRISIQREAEHLKLESFGVHILNTIGEVFISKGNEYGWYRSFGRLSAAYYYPHEKYAAARDTAKTVWNLLDAQKAIREARLDDMEESDANKIKQERGIEEQKLIETIASGKMLLSCWGLVRKDLMGILKEACNLALYDPNIQSDSIERRAKGLMIIGKVFIDMIK